MVGLDAITDTAAVAALKTAKVMLPNASISLFYHPKRAASCITQRRCFSGSCLGGTCLTGSGNLTLGGLRNNWEAFWKADLSVADAIALEAQWANWLANHKDNLLAVDDPRVTAQAALNAKTKAKIQKTVNETDAEALTALEEGFGGGGLPKLSTEYWWSPQTGQVRRTLGSTLTKAFLVSPSASRGR